MDVSSEYIEMSEEAWKYLKVPFVELSGIIPTVFVIESLGERVTTALLYAYKDAKILFPVLRQDQLQDMVIGEGVYAGDRLADFLMELFSDI